MTFNTDPVAYINGAEFKFYKNFPEAYSDEAKVKILNELIHYLESKSDSSYYSMEVLRRKILYKFTPFEPGVYVLNLLQLDTEFLTNLYYVITTANICLLGLTKAKFNKLRKNTKEQIRERTLSIIRRAVRIGFDDQEYKEVYTLMRIAIYYGMADIKDLPYFAKVSRFAQLPNIRGYNSGSVFYVCPAYLRKMNSEVEKLLHRK